MKVDGADVYHPAARVVCASNILCLQPQSLQLILLDDPFNYISVNPTCGPKYRPTFFKELDMEASIMNTKKAGRFGYR